MRKNCKNRNIFIWNFCILSIKYCIIQKKWYFITFFLFFIFFSRLENELYRKVLILNCLTHFKSYIFEFWPIKRFMTWKKNFLLIQCSKMVWEKKKFFMILLYFCVNELNFYFIVIFFSHEYKKRDDNRKSGITNRFYWCEFAIYSFNIFSLDF